MELGFIESLRRRWDVLGINASDKGKGKALGIDEEQADDSEDIGAASRQDIMQGAIVRSVLTSAVQGTVGLSYFVNVC
jgi:U3 small nucleolar RNA-associated protein 6